FSSGFDRTLAATTALLLAAVAVVCVAGERLIRPRTVRTRTTASARPAVELGRAGTAATMTALAVVTAASVLFPVVALGIRMLRSDRYASTPVDLAGALGTTVGISALAATVAVAVALPVSILAARYRGPLVTGLESVSYLGHALPGVVVALALVTLSLQFFPGAYQSALVLLAAYGILFLPKSIGASRAAIAQVPEELEETSRTLGRGPVRTWLRVTLPGALPGILAGWVLVATAVAKELPATLMLRPIGFDTLATELWSKTSLGAYGAAAPIGVLLILAGIAPALLLARGLERRRTTSGRMAP
ncbi:MAG: ABC transporter permease, partial [Microbacterium aurantiacum]